MPTGCTFRFLETDDEYFDPAGGHHRQGFWMIYGIFLPDGVLAKLYSGNAKTPFRAAQDVPGS